MSDTTDILQLPGASLEAIEQHDDELILRFSQVKIVQEMENAFEDSLWTQAVDLTIRNFGVEGDLPDCPCEIEGRDLTDNIYTYRDHAPLPIDWRGEVHCVLRIAGSGALITASGNAMHAERIDFPRYIQHIKKA